MINEDRAAEYVQSQINHKRFLHSIATASEAETLAKALGADGKKARMAGLLHDVGKGHACDAARYGIELDAIETMNPELAHGRIGAAMVKADLGVDDDEILSAITCHTTGKANMTLLDKIIYLADIIEPGRTFEGVERVRALAPHNVDEAMIFALEKTIAFVQCNGFTLHPKSVEAYQYLLDRRKQ
jgi:predicted HD superfamily hydrolase involved in NAD metabolism